jgi:hypothetical protein
MPHRPLRKSTMPMRANALVVFLGGFGTLDELFERLTLMQTIKMPLIPIVLVDKSYWTSIVNFGRLVEEGMVAPEDLHLFSHGENAESAWNSLVREGLKPGPRPLGFPSLPWRSPRVKAEGNLRKMVILYLNRDASWTHHGNGRATFHLWLIP